MPLYEFECKNCGAIIEKLMKISDSNPEICDHCQGGPLVKLMSRTNFVLKGQGWYETDFKHNGKNPKPKDPAKSEETSDKPTSKGDGDSSSKKDAKSEPKPASAKPSAAKEG